MRTLIRMFDADDARWIITMLLAVGLFYALDRCWQLEAAHAKLLARMWENELEHTELATQVQAVRRNCDGHWGQGSLCIE